MRLNSEDGNAWGMTDTEMEYYGRLSIPHQEYLPWLFVNYEEEAASNADNIKKVIGILQNRKINTNDVWMGCFEWNTEHERSKHFVNPSMSIHHLARLIFPFLSQKQEYKVFCDAIISMICNQSMKVDSFPWQGEYFQLVESQIDGKKIKAITDERSRVQLYAELDNGLKILAKISHIEFFRAAAKNWHLSKCADVWASYLDYIAIHGAIPSRLHFGVGYRGEQPEACYLQPPPASPPQKDPNNSKAPALLEACISAWNSDVRNNNINPTDAKALFVYASDRGVKGYEGLKVDFREKYSVRVIRWDWDSVYWKHFVTAFKGRPV